jgi:hypothetical protein
MSAPNFQTQNDFDLYVFDENYYFDNLAEEEKIYWLDEFKEDFENLSDVEIEEKLRKLCLDSYYNWFEDDFEELEYQLSEEKQTKYRPLEFFEIKYKSGYYVGVQLYVEHKYYIKDYISEDFEKFFDNDDFHYVFGECKSKVLKRYQAEIKRINKVILPYYAKRLFMIKLNLIGVFSNGEAVYEVER